MDYAAGLRLQKYCAPGYLLTMNMTARKTSTHLSGSGRYRVQSRVLIVDSSPSARAMIAKAFESQATMIDCVGCDTAEQALKHLRDSRFDLVTTSLLLPGIDGLELCRTIRADKDLQLIPVIIISGNADKRLLKEGFSSGVSEYFNKTRGFPELAKFVASYLERTYGSAHRILLVEDSATAAKAIRDTLTRQGMQVVHYRKAEDALKLLEEVDMDDDPTLSFDLVLTDFNLEGTMTGGDLLYAIRNQLNKSTQELPVLVMTGNDSAGKQVEFFNAGANDYVNKPAVEQVLVARVRSLVLIRQQYLALERQKQQMEELSLTDSLTGTWNRRFLSERGALCAGDCEYLPMSVLIMDIDHFKEVNDAHGHLTGDKVLRNIGTTLIENLPDDAMVIRYGGEEFCALLPFHDIHKATIRCEDIRSKVGTLDTEGIRVSLSIGVSCITRDNQLSLDKALRKADIALYTAKQNGRNRVEFAET